MIKTRFDEAARLIGALSNLAAIVAKMLGGGDVNTGEEERGAS